jgi:sugar lactone lactonase YvrE
LLRIDGSNLCLEMKGCLMRARSALIATSTVILSTSWAFTGTATAQTADPTGGTPIIYRAAGNGMTGFGGDGQAAGRATLNRPTGVTADISGNMFFADSLNNRVRKVTSSSSGIINTVAGNGSSGFGGDGGPANAAQLSRPSGVAIDSMGNLFIADTLNNRIRLVSTSGQISTYAGNGNCDKGDDDPPGQDDNSRSANIGDGGKATNALLCAPTGLTVDRIGNLYIADTGHNRIRKVSPSGIISTIAGTGSSGSNGDGGPATSAALAGPTGLALDVAADLFVADTGNNKVRVVNTGGMISTFAGTGSSGFAGDGGPATSAKLAGPTGLGIDPGGNVYVSDTKNNRIRVIKMAGAIATYAGTGVKGYFGDGGPATSAQMNDPTGTVIADGTHLYFSDTGNQRVRAITSGPPPMIPETNYILMLPISAVLLGGAGVGYLTLRRRRKAQPLH